MKRYRSHKEVAAMKIARIEPGRIDGRGPGRTLYAADGEAVSVSDEWNGKHQPDIGGYFVLYADGYQSFSPAKAFEEGYTEIETTAADLGLERVG